jgi:hypothetical protein
MEPLDRFWLMVCKFVLEGFPSKTSMPIGAWKMPGMLPCMDSCEKKHHVPFTVASIVQVVDNLPTKKHVIGISPPTKVTLWKDSQLIKISPRLPTPTRHLIQQHLQRLQHQMALGESLFKECTGTTGATWDPC